MNILDNLIYRPLIRVFSWVMRRRYGVVTIQYSLQQGELIYTFGFVANQPSEDSFLLAHNKYAMEHLENYTTRIDIESLTQG